MTTAHLVGEKRLLLTGIDWREYCRMLHALGSHRGIRLTYDRGDLEIMTTSPGHEKYSHLLALIITALCEELNLPCSCYGSMTFKYRPKQRGLEPDKCFWIQNATAVRRLEKYAPRKDPPPDLVVEIEISRSAINRMKLYATMRVPEVWRYDAERLTFHELGAKNRYVPIPQSRAFPLIKPADIEPFLAMWGQSNDDIPILRQFRAWLRQHLAAGGNPPTTP